MYILNKMIYTKIKTWKQIGDEEKKKNRENIKEEEAEKKKDIKMEKKILFPRLNVSLDYR